MAASIVGSVVNFSLQNLLRLLAAEINLRSGIKAKIKSLSKELEYMDIFLKRAEEYQEDDLVKVVMNQIRDAAYEAEDVVDTYIANVTLQRRRNIFSRLLHYFSQEMMFHDVDSQIDNIKKSIYEIYDNKDKYNIKESEFQSESSLGEEAPKSLRERRRYVEEDEVVGLVHDAAIVIEKLKEENSNLTVNSIIGMGGLGKTTLARKIYNMDLVKDKFSCRAWGYVSNDYRATELMLSLLQCLNSSKFEYKDLSVVQLKEKVRECLKGRKYLIVLDDIWKTQVWDDLKEAFPDDKNGSRILITSRLKEVALYTGPNPPYYLPLLNENESWELFCKKVFWGEECPNGLESLGRKMVESCKGLPLAIIVLAGLVSKKEKSQREWIRIKDGINRHLSEDKTVIDILKLSFDDLPRELKPCFLYLGIYPEDYEIPARQLMKLWIAEGFIRPKEIRTTIPSELEDIADLYLDELVDRSLMQVVSKRHDGGVKTCRIHDLLRDLCILESKENKFMEVCNEMTIDKCCSRRLSVHCKKAILPTRCSLPHPRSLIMFGDEHERGNKSEGREWITKALKLVRVLDLHSMRLISLPTGLKSLIHLRYLFVAVEDSTTANDILASACNLWNLETLDLWSAYTEGKFIVIPSGMWKLKRLRNVSVRHRYYKFWGGDAEAAHMARGENSEASLSLQTLGKVYVSGELESMLNNDLFPNLTKLTLYVDAYSVTIQQLSSLYRLSKLQKLKLICPQKLNISLGVNVLPSNITKITLLIGFQWESGIINTLGRLPNLQILKLHGSLRIINPSINCVAGDFPRLEVLCMKEILVNWQWRLEKGAMPHLRHLILNSCRYVDEQDETWKPLAQLFEDSAQLNSDCVVVVKEDTRFL